MSEFYLHLPGKGKLELWEYYDMTERKLLIFSACNSSKSHFYPFARGPPYITLVLRNALHRHHHHYVYGQDCLTATFVKADLKEYSATDLQFAMYPLNLSDREIKTRNKSPEMCL